MYKNTSKIVGNFVDFLPDIADNIYIRGKEKQTKGTDHDSSLR